MSDKEDTIEKSLSHFPVFKENPYMPPLIVPQKNKVVSVSVKGLPLFDLSTGELQNEVAFIGIKEKVDKEQFVKIFKSQIQSLFGLSVIGIRVFGYFMSITRISTDTVIFRYKDCMEYTKYKSRSSVQKGLAELLQHEFIARTDSPSIYFLNPSIFFNGDRMVILREYTVDKQSKEIENNHDFLEDITAKARVINNPDNQQE